MLNLIKKVNILIKSPLYFILMTIFSTFIIELFIHFILVVFYENHPELVHELVFVLGIVPVLYLFLYRPMKYHLTAKENAEQKLLEANNELENRVSARTAELEQLSQLIKDEYAERLQLSEEKYRNFINGLGVGVTLIDSNMRIITANNKFVEWFPEVDISKNPVCYEVFHSRSDICDDCPTHKTFLDGEVHQAIIEYQSAHWKIIASPIKNAHGEVIYVTESIEIVTAQIKAETSLREQNVNLHQQIGEHTNQINAILESIYDPVFLLDSGGRFVLLNSSSENLLQRNQKDLIGKSIWDEFPEARGLFGKFNQALEKGLAFEFEYEAEQSNKWLDVRAYPCAQGVVVYLTDLTQRKQIELDLRQSYGKLKETLTETVDALASMQEKKDPYTAGHMKRVSKLAVAIANEMGLSAKQIEGISIAGALHDIGKIYAPSDILNKPGKLAQMEIGIIKEHVQVGYDILEKIPFDRPVAEIILQHHERINGSGYPKGLLGDDMLLEAKILAVADVVDAMASHRPYRPSLGIDMAIEEIKRNKGILYDIEVVNACLRVFDSGYKFDLKPRIEVV